MEEHFEHYLILEDHSQGWSTCWIEDEKHSPDKFGVPRGFGSMGCGGSLIETLERMSNDITLIAHDEIGLEFLIMQVFVNEKMYD